MIDPLTLLLGPLAEPECRRALGRGWVILVRSLAAVAVLAVALTVIWWWWVVVNTGDGHAPYTELRIGFGIVLGMMIGGALLLGPSVMAGSLAGEKERGSLGLMLATSASPREIVSGRVAGKYSQVAMVVLAAAPSPVLLGSLAGFAPVALATALLVPLAVGFGGVGLASAASCLSRRGRDALLTVYLCQVLILVAVQSGAVAPPAPVDAWFAALDPFSSIEPLMWREDVGPAARVATCWGLLGLIGVGVASWRLRPATLGATGRGEGRRRASRSLWVPPVSERRPMLWKELFIERVGTIGRFGNVVGLVLILALAGGSGLLGLLLLGSVTGDVSTETAAWARSQLGDWVGGTGGMLVALIQWAIGLRASVSISSERERGTWIGLMTSPLEPSEIVRGKLWGSLHALRWLIAAAFFAWTVAAVAGATTDRELMTWVAGVLFVGAYMAAVGVRVSLTTETATKAMAITLGIWLVSIAVVWLTSALLILAGLLLCNTALVTAAQMGLVPPPTAFWAPFRWSTIYPIVSNGLYGGLTLSVVADTRLRFDRLAGRMTEGRLAVAFDRFFYGQPEAPVLAPRGDAPDAADSGAVAGGTADRLVE